MKKIVVLILGIGLSMQLFGQDTIPFPSQQEFRKYIFSRFDELQSTLFEQVINGNLSAYTDYVGYVDTMIILFEGHEIQSSTIDIYLPENEKQKEFFAEDIQGLSLQYKNSKALPSYLGLIDYSFFKSHVKAGINNTKDTVFHIQSDSIKPLFWLNFNNALKYINKQDSSFITLLVNFEKLVQSTSWELWHEEANLTRDYDNDTSYIVLLDSIAQEKFSRLVSYSSLIFEFSKIEVIDCQKNQLYKMDSLLIKHYPILEEVMILDKQLSNDSISIHKIIEVPAKLQWRAPHSFIVKDSQVVQYEISTDSFSYLYKIDEENELHQYHFSIPKESIETSAPLKELSAWIMDYYLWKKRNTKQDK